MQKRRIAVNDLGRPIGEDHPNAKLTDGDVDRLFALVGEGFTSAEIAGMLEVSVDTVKKIRCGQRRNQLTFGHKVVHVSR